MLVSRTYGRVGIAVIPSAEKNIEHQSGLVFEAFLIREQ